MNHQRTARDGLRAAALGLLMGIGLGRPLAACPAPESFNRSGAAPAAVAITPRGGPEEVGQWLPPMDWPCIAVHAAVMPTGEVLHYSAPDASDGSRAITWNPMTGTFTDVNAPTDIFCSGLTVLENGRVFVAGGNNHGCDFKGRQVTHVFDPVEKSWTFLEFMATGRWYPNTAKLGDGRVIITSGLDTNCALTSIMEMYTPGEGLEVIPQGERLLQLFPRTHLLTSGKLAHVGPEQLTSTYDPVTRQWHPVDFSDGGFRCSGTSVLVPGSIDTVMIIGGYVDTVPTATCERMDFNDPETGWEKAASLNFARAHANAVLLPDQTLVLIGGGTFGSYEGPILNPERYDPRTGAWTVLPPQVYSRMYHSTAVLLPDGRVLSAGQDDGDSAYQAELYEPAYLFKGDRPTIDQAPAVIRYGETFTITTAQAADIDSVVLMALGAVTHSVDTNQRYVGLDFTVNENDEVLATAPVSGNHAPPGYYMLFILNTDGVPSESAMVQLTDDPPPPDCEGDANADNIVDPLDSGYVLSRFGCSVGTGDPPCDAADQNADGIVDPLDVGFVLARFGDCP